MTTTVNSPDSVTDLPAQKAAPQDGSPTPEMTAEDTKGQPEQDSSGIGPRRNYLINRKRQLRSAFLIVFAVVLLLIPLNYAFHTVRLQESATITSSNPGLRGVMDSRDLNELVVGVIASAIILIGAFALTIIETHRTAGAAYAIARRMDDVREGEYDTRLSLRGSDNLRELEGPFNAMAEGLRDGAAEDARVLEELAERASDVVVPSEDHEIATRLRRLAKTKRRAAGTA